MALHPLDNPLDLERLTLNLDLQPVKQATGEREGCQNTPIIGVSARRVKQFAINCRVIVSPEIWRLQTEKIKNMDNLLSTTYVNAAIYVLHHWHINCIFRNRRVAPGNCIAELRTTDQASALRGSYTQCRSSPQARCRFPAKGGPFFRRPVTGHCTTKRQPLLTGEDAADSSAVSLISPFAVK